jgi:hypothetical protein
MAKPISTYTNTDGVLVQVFAYRKPQSRTWPMVKGTVANKGAKATMLTSQGINCRMKA